MPPKNASKTLQNVHRQGTGTKYSCRYVLHLILYTDLRHPISVYCACVFNPLLFLGAQERLDYAPHNSTRHKQQRLLLQSSSTKQYHGMQQAVLVPKVFRTLQHTALARTIRTTAAITRYHIAHIYDIVRTSIPWQVPYVACTQPCIGTSLYHTAGYHVGCVRYCCTAVRLYLYTMYQCKRVPGIWYDTKQTTRYVPDTCYTFCQRQINTWHPEMWRRGDSDRTTCLFY